MQTMQRAPKQEKRQFSVQPEAQAEERTKTMLEVIERRELASHTFVELIKHGNDDDAVRDAARVSHDACAKSASATLIEYLAKNDHFTPFGHVRFLARAESIDESALLEWSMDRLPGWQFGRDYRKPGGAFWFEGSLYNWLGVHDDLPPLNGAQLNDIRVAIARSGCEQSVRAFIGNDEFERISASRKNSQTNAEDIVTPGSWSTIRVRAPLFVLRQLMRSNHEIVYNEVSRRYIVSAPLFYMPDAWRNRPTKGVKQGSGIGFVRTFNKKLIEEWIRHRGAFPFAIDLDTAYNDWIQTGGELYHLFEQSGVAPELARCVLPQSMYSEVWMSASWQAYDRVCMLRSNRGENNHAQREIEEISRAVESVLGYGQ